MSDTIIELLREPFPASDIQWMPQSLGASGSGKPWIMVLAYVDARALQERMDSVFDYNGWQVKYRHEGSGVICSLGIRHDNEWIWKEDGAPETDIESYKGGISSAFKRVCASGYGIGRYLYDLGTSFANCQLEKPAGSRDQLKKDGWNKADDKKKNLTIYWKTPTLPEWALPKAKKAGK